MSVERCTPASGRCMLLRTSSFFSTSQLLACDTWTIGELDTGSLSIKLLDVGFDVTVYVGASRHLPCTHAGTVPSVGFDVSTHPLSCLKPPSWLGRPDVNLFLSLSFPFFRVNGTSHDKITVGSGHCLCVTPANTSIPPTLYQKPPTRPVEASCVCSCKASEVMQACI